jgi:hypothetical protein
LRASKNPGSGRGATPSKRAAAPAVVPSEITFEDEPEEDSPEVIEDAPPLQARRAKPRAARNRRRISSGPSKLVLSLLAAGSLLAIGGAAALLGLIPGVMPQHGNPQVVRGTLHAPAASAAAPKAPVTRAAPRPLPAQPAPSAPAIAPVKTESVRSPAAQAKTLPAPAPAQSPRPEPSAKPETPAAPVQASTDDEGGSASQALIAAARKRLAEDDPQGAEALMRQALAKDPRDHHAMELLAHALMDQDRGADALPFARKIVARRPRRVSYRLLLGDLLLMVGNEAAARNEWEEARKIAPDDPQIKRRLGR